MPGSKTLIAFLLIWSVIANSCKQANQPHDNASDEELKELLINANIAARHAEEEQINDFIGRHRWEMQKTGSGLRYMIYKQGNGAKAEEGKIAKISYSLSLITGNEVYSSDEGGPMAFLIGKGGVESGLEEAILLLHVGDKAKIIIPSHLGFGLAGDDHRIPPKATLIYDIELLEIK